MHVYLTLTQKNSRKGNIGQSIRDQIIIIAFNERVDSRNVINFLPSRNFLDNFLKIKVACHFEGSKRAKSVAKDN